MFMKKLVLLAALFAAVAPAVNAQEAADQSEVKTFCVGDYENPENNKYVGDGSFWEKAPFQFYNTYTGIQIIYDAQYLEALAEDNGAITEIEFKMGDNGSYVEAEADLTLYIQNTDVTEFEQLPYSDYYAWFTFDPSSSYSKVHFQQDLYGWEDLIFHFTLDKPLQYEGKNLLITAWSEVLDDKNTTSAFDMINYAMETGKKTTMQMGDDKTTFMETYDTGVQYPYQGPNKYVPITKFTYTTNSGVSSVAGDASNGDAQYFNLQGQPVSGELVPGIYISRQGGEAKKIVIR